MKIYRTSLIETLESVTANLVTRYMYNRRPLAGISVVQDINRLFGHSFKEQKITSGQAKLKQIV